MVDQTVLAQLIRTTMLDSIQIAGGAVIGIILLLSLYVFLRDRIFKSL